MIKKDSKKASKKSASMKFLKSIKKRQSSTLYYGKNDLEINFSSAVLVVSPKSQNLNSTVENGRNNKMLNYEYNLNQNQEAINNCNRICYDSSKINLNKINSLSTIKYSNKDDCCDRSENTYDDGFHSDNTQPKLKSSICYKDFNKGL